MTDLKLFDKWETKVEIEDPGLVSYINLKPVIVPRNSHGRHSKKKFYKSDISIVERLMNHLFVPGHKGKKHKTTSRQLTGKGTTAYSIMKETLEIIEDNLGKNPVEVLVKAIENAALREEVSAYQMGSIIARKAVITAPQRRVDMALRFFAQGAYRKTFKNKKSMAMCLADEIMAAYNKSKESVAVSEKERIEREAEGAR